VRRWLGWSPRYGVSGLHGRDLRRVACEPRQVREEATVVSYACVTVELIQPIAMEKNLRFAIREGGRTVGAGQVTEIIE